MSQFSFGGIQNNNPYSDQVKENIGAPLKKKTDALAPSIKEWTGSQTSNPSPITQQNQYYHQQSVVLLLCFSGDPIASLKATS